MKPVFNPRFVGLQIFWGEDNEIEYLGPAVLKGLSHFTAASCIRGEKKFHYLYPVTYAHRQNQLVIKYSKNPDKWLGWGWQLCEGDLIIDFDDGNDGRPISLSYRYEDGSGEEELKLGDDWVYRHKEADFDEINVRGRVKFSRLERPNQQALRNLLISEYGKCQVTGTKCTAALEACHIIPVRDRGNDDIGNALLLRRDIHSLFDAGLLWFQLTGDEWKVVISENVVEDDEYVGKLNGVVIARADDQCHRYLIQREKFDWGGKQV